jgi:MoxR-like ATPase
MQALIFAGKITAMLDGRYNVAVDDLRAVAYPVLRHRLILGFEAQGEGVTADKVIRVILDKMD